MGLSFSVAQLCRDVIRLFVLCLVFANKAAGAEVQINERFSISSEVAAIGGISTAVRIGDVSSDGSVTIGIFNKNKTWQVFRYVRGQKAESVEQLPKDSSTLLCLSGDGQVIWGSLSTKDQGNRLLRYTQSQGLEDLGTFDRTGIRPHAASADGSVVVGSFYALTPENRPIYHAFRYSARDGFQDLGSMGAESAFARGVSADGSVVVGNFHVKNSSDHAFLYSSARTVQDLGAIGGTAAFATGISDNGIVAGTYFDRLDFFKQSYESSVFVYTQSSGVTKLGAMGGVSVGLVRVSANGKRIVGSYRDAAGQTYVYIGTIK